MPRKWTDEQLINALADCHSIRCVLKKLGLVPAGGNYTFVNRRIKELNLDTSHITGKIWNKGKTLKRKSVYEFLIYAPTNSSKLRLKLLDQNIKEHICEKCKLTKWLEKPIPLELHHIDGDKDNNVLENLLLLCPNCHSSTDNYRGKNKGSGCTPTAERNDLKSFQ